MLVIRLQRTGRENTPTYRIVLAEHTQPVKGKFLEILGHYLPAREPRVFEVNKERVEHWVSKGAQPSETMARLLKAHGVKNMDKFIKKYTKQVSKKNPPPAPETPAPAPKAEAAPAAEAPAAEPVAEAAPEAPAAAPEAPAVETPAA